MVRAVACADVPKLTVIVGGSFGAGNYGMHLLSHCQIGTVLLNALIMSINQEWLVEQYVFLPFISQRRSVDQFYLSVSSTHLASYGCGP